MSTQDYLNGHINAYQTMLLYEQAIAQMFGLPKIELQEGDKILWCDELEAHIENELESGDELVITAIANKEICVSNKSTSVCIPKIYAILGRAYWMLENKS